MPDAEPNTVDLRIQIPASLMRRIRICAAKRDLGNIRDIVIEALEQLPDDDASRPQRRKGTA